MKSIKSKCKICNNHDDTWTFNDFCLKCQKKMKKSSKSMEYRMEEERQECIEDKSPISLQDYSMKI